MDKGHPQKNCSPSSNEIIGIENNVERSKKGYLDEIEI